MSAKPPREQLQIEPLRKQLLTEQRGAKRTNHSPHHDSYGEAQPVNLIN